MKNWTNHKSGRLTVLGFDRMHVTPSGCKHPRWKCRCECGKETSVFASSLRLARSKSCGCLKIELNLRDHTIHGHSKRTGQSPEYFTWKAMHGRCRQTTYHGWNRYGGRGIYVCSRWNSFENFFADMGKRPNGKTLDRIDTNGNYEPSNCRWATAKEQAENSRPRKKRTV